MTRKKRRKFPSTTTENGSVGTDHGYCYRIRDSGGDCSCSFGGHNWKDYAEIHKVSGFRAQKPVF